MTTEDQGDPPNRVGRVAGVAGTVSFRNASDTQWSLASTNYPVASGNAFWTEPAAQVSLEVSASRIALAPQTEFDVTTLDSSGLQAVAPQGEIYLHLNDLAPNEVWSVQTPRGQLRLSSAGRFGIVVGTTEQPTVITVLDGAAQIEGPGVSLRLSANQSATITGTDPFQGSVDPAIRDSFLTSRLNAERPPARPTIAAPLAARVDAMPGGEDLVSTGSWAPAPQYGQVWYPPVSPGWVPYRHGHWAYVAPWGWTWVDDASWGFAPFHYGRWVQINDRWGWTPGEAVATEPPVYAPALVTFIGVAAGVALGAALAGGSVGWIPLGPREAYHPWYHASENYVRQVNVSQVTNISNVSNVTTVNNYINRGAATSVPAAVMTGSRPVQAAAQPMTPQQFAAARPVFGQQPIRPTTATVGVTPAVARQLNLAPAGATTARVAPGPVVRAQALVPATPGHPERPPLLGGHGQAPAAAQPAPAALPGAAATPGAAAPAAGMPRTGAAATGAHEAGRPPNLVTPGSRPTGLATTPSEPHPGVAAVPGPGVAPRAPGQPPAATTPGEPAAPGHPAALAAPSVAHPAGIPPAAGARPEGIPRAIAGPANHPAEMPGRENRSAAMRAAENQPGPAPASRPAATGNTAAVPHVQPPVVAHPVVPPPQVHPVPAPLEASRAAPVAAPHVEPVRPPPPHLEASRPPQPHIEAARPPPPHIEAAHPPPERQKRPGEP